MLLQNRDLVVLNYSWVKKIDNKLVEQFRNQQVTMMFDIELPVSSMKS